LSDGELLSASYAFANGYQDLGVGPGTVVASFMENCLEHAYSWGAASFLGAGHLPCNTFLRGDFLAHQLGRTEAKVVVVDQHLAERVLQIRDKLPHLAHLVVRGSDSEAAAFATSDLVVSSTEALLAAESEKLLVERPARYDDLNAIIFTGGTTGPSKGVAISQNYMVSMQEATRRCNGWTSESTFYQPLPLFHINAFGLTIVGPVLFGGQGVTASRLSITEFWNNVRRYGATHLSLFGSLYLMLWNQPERQSDADNPAQVSTGYCPLEIHKAFEKRFGIRIYGSYALSEAVMVASTTPDDVPEPGWAGRPCPEFDVRLFDDEDQEVPVGEVGEICIRPRKPHVMFSGYFNDPQGTVDAFRNLWFHTQDLGKMNAEGYLAFVDRKADYLRRRGENISTYEVEQVLLHYPGLVEVAVHGVPSEIGDEEVKACLRLAPDTAFDPRHFLDFCVAGLPYYAVPRFIEIMDELPRSPVGRIQKFQLKARGVTPETFDRETIGYHVSR
jgi:crotonobetaine/carnitine-CoA ligase